MSENNKVLLKNIEIMDLKKEIDKLISINVDLKEKLKSFDEIYNQPLHHLLTEIHDRMYKMVEHLELLHPVILSEKGVSYLTNEDELYYESDLFKVGTSIEMTDQTGRSMLKDLRKVIKFVKNNNKLEQEEKQLEEIQKFLQK